MNKSFDEGPIVGVEKFSYCRRILPDTLAILAEAPLLHVKSQNPDNVWVDSETSIDTKDFRDRQ